jgi:predicted metal-binding protein
MFFTSWLHGCLRSACADEGGFETYAEQIGNKLAVTCGRCANHGSYSTAFLNRQTPALINENCRSRFKVWGRYIRQQGGMASNFSG